MADLRVDARLELDVATLLADVSLADADLALENGLESALVLSLFCDARATPDELERFGAEDPRGFWGDAFAEFSEDRWGSRLWLLSREVATAETLNRAREYAREALDWLVEDGIAERVEIDAEYQDRTRLALRVTVVRGAEAERFGFVWEL